MASSPSIKWTEENEFNFLEQLNQLITEDVTEENAKTFIEGYESLVKNVLKIPMPVCITSEPVVVREDFAPLVQGLHMKYFVAKIGRTLQRLFQKYPRMTSAFHFFEVGSVLKLVFGEYKSFHDLVDTTNSPDKEAEVEFQFWNTAKNRYKLAKVFLSGDENLSDAAFTACVKAKGKTSIENEKISAFIALQREALSSDDNTNYLAMASMLQHEKAKPHKKRSPQRHKKRSPKKTHHGRRRSSKKSRQPKKTHGRKKSSKRR